MQSFFPILFCMVYFTSYITRINYGAVISEVILDLGITKGAAGLAVTGCFITYGLGQPFVGWLGDHVPPKYIITAGLIGTSICNFAASGQNSPYVIAVIWCINGFCQSMMWPPLVRIIAETMPADNYRKTCVNVITAANLGTVLVYLTAPILIRFGSWRMILILPACIAVTVALIWQIFVKAGTSARTAVTTGAKADSTAKSGVNGSNAIAPGASDSDTAALSTANLCILSGVPFILGAIILQGLLRDGITTWMPSYINEAFSLGTGISILTTTILPLFAIACVRLSAKVYSRCKNNELIASILFFAVAAICCLLLYLCFDRIMISILLMAVICGCTHAVNQMLISNMPVRYAPFGRVSTMSGFFNAFTYIGSALSAYGFAVLADHFGWKPLVLIWTLCSGVGTLLCIANLKRWTAFIRINE